MTEYKETVLEAGDTGSDVLEALAAGKPHVFIVCTVDTDGELDLSVSIGGGITDASILRSVLEKTLRALP